jgi:hypothetical protein
MMLSGTAKWHIFEYGKHNIEQFTIYDNILPIYERFCRELNQYSFLTDFRLACCSLKTNNYAVVGAIDMISDTRDTLPQDNFTARLYAKH